MRFEGRIKKVGKYWAVEIPALAAHTQGKSLHDAYEMAKAWVRDMLDRQDFPVEVYPGKGGTFEIGSEDNETMVAFMLRRQREAHGLSLTDVAAALGQSSRTAYARYEQGTSSPTISKLAELLRAVGGIDIVVRPVK